MQPLSPAGGVRDLLGTGRQHDRLRAHRRRLLRGAAAECAVHGTAERAAAHHLLARPAIPVDPSAGLRDGGYHAGLCRGARHIPRHEDQRTEDITRAYAEARAVPLTPCDCSLRTGTVRRSLRGIFSELEKEYPHVKENMLSAMGNVDTKRLLDPRLLEMERPELFPILGEA